MKSRRFRHSTAVNRCCPCAAAKPSGARRTICATANLFAALDFKAGTVIGSLHQRHRAIEFRKFLQTIDDTVPRGRELHLIR